MSSFVTYSKDISLSNYLKKKKFTFTEKVDMVKFKIIIDNYTAQMGLMRVNFEPVDVEQSHTILKNMYEAKRLEDDVSYKQSKSSPDGRLFALSPSLQGVERKIRHTISADIYWDIDIKNCHPIILIWYCETNDIPCESVQYYVNNREKCFTELMEFFSMDKDSVKRGLLSIMNGGQGFKKIETIPNLPLWLIDYYNNCILIHEQIAKLNPQLVASIKANKGAGYYNINGCVTNHILCKWENYILLHMAYFCEVNNVKIGTLCFDGLMIYKKENFELNSFLKEMSQFVLKKTGINVKIVEKPMNEILDLSGLASDESITSYIEKKNDLFIPPLENHLEIARFVLEKNEGNIFYYSKTKSIFIYNEENKLFEETKNFDKLMVIAYETMKITLNDYLEHDIPKKERKMIEAYKIKKLGNGPNLANIKRSMVSLLKPCDIFIENTFNQIKYLYPFQDKVFDFKANCARARVKEDYFTYTTDNNYKSDYDDKSVYTYFSQLLKTENPYYINCFALILAWCQH